jgi:hypothetical protein
MGRRLAWLCQIAAAAVWLGCDGSAPISDVARQESDAGAVDADAGVADADAGVGPDAAAAPAVCPELPASTAICPDPPPSFTNDVLPILNQRCNNCHDPSLTNGPWPLDNYYDVSEWEGLIATDLVNCAMPPPDGGTTLPEAERERVMSWIVCGTPNN